MNNNNSPVNAPKTIKRYRNRKLYDCTESKYIGLADVLAMDEGTFVVIQNETRNDITNETLISALASHYLANPQAFVAVKSDLLGRIKGRV